MQIIALELENVKSYEHARFEFTPGVNAIVGQNGAGKSTIIEAIGYTLFDALPYTVSEFVREGARTGSIAVTFLSTYDERPYRVERRFGGSNAYAVHDEELQGKVCDGKTDVLSFIRRHTLADPSVELTRLFNDALGVAQGALTAAFAETPARRKPIFDALLQVDDYSTASDRLREPARRVRERIVENDRSLAVLTTRLEQLPVLKETVKTRAVEMQKTRRALEKLEQALVANQEHLQTLEAEKAAVDTFTTQAARQEEAVRSLEAQHVRVKQALERAENAAAVVAENQAGYDAYLAAQLEQESLQVRAGERQALLNQRAAADKDLALTVARCAQIEQTLAEIGDAEKRLRELEPAIRKQGELEEKVAIADRAQATVAELDRRIAAIEAQKRKLDERHASISAGRERAHFVEEQGKEINRQLVDLRADLDRAREQATLTTVEIANVEAQSEALGTIDMALCPVCEQPLTPDHRAELLGRNRERIIGLQHALRALQGAVARHEEKAIALEEERLRLQKEWTSLPRDRELADATQALVENGVELASAVTERGQLAGQDVVLAELRQALAALGDPRAHYAVAEARAALRGQEEVRLAAEQQRQAGIQRQIAAFDQGLQTIGELDAELTQNAAALRQHAPAYQSVLTYRQAADGLANCVVELEEIGHTLRIARDSAEDTRANLKVASEKFDLANYQQVLLEERKMREELGGLTTSVALMREMQDRDEAQILSLQAEQASQLALEQERRWLARQEEALETVRTVIKQAGPFITQAVVRQVSASAATIFGDLMHDHSRVLAWSEDYGITLTVGGSTRAFRQLSGGEQMSAALAVRLALVREMSNINVAFFDEPTANLDSVRREALAQQLMTVRGFDQLFVISHDDTFEQATQNLIRVSRHGNKTIVGDVTG